LGTEPYFTVIDGEMRYAPAELEEEVARITVALVLLYRVFNRLLGKTVLQFKRCKRQTVDE
jgi:hypothetical protein